MEDTHKTEFQRLLHYYLDITGRTWTWLKSQSEAERIKDSPIGLNKGSLVRWYQGLKSPQSWIDVIRIAALLQLGVSDTDILLAASKPRGKNARQVTVEDLVRRLPHTDVESNRVMQAYLDTLSDLNMKAALVAIESLAHLPADRLPPRHTLSLNPGARQANDLFVGREQVLLEMAALLKSRGLQTTSQCLVVTGLAGAGKTATVTEFVYRYGVYFAGGVFWIPCADSQLVDAHIAACGESPYLNLPAHFAHLSVPEQAELVKLAWQQPIPRLIIFDNCEDESLLQQCRPAGPSCSVLVTSRRDQWSGQVDVQTYALPGFTRVESIDLLKHHRPDIPADLLGDLAEELGFLPLALQLAGGFLEDNQYDHARGDPQTYLQRLRHSFATAADAPHDEYTHIAQIFYQSLHVLDIADPCDDWAKRLLCLAACFMPGEPIPQQLLISAARKSGASEDVERLANRGLSRLLAMGLMTRGQSQTIVAHRIIVALMQQEARLMTIQYAVEDAVLELAEHLYEEERLLEMVPIAMHLAYAAQQAQPRADERAATLCNQFAEYLYSSGNYEEAEDLFSWTLSLRRELLRAPHSDIAISLDNYADLLRALGRDDEAYTMSVEALTMFEETLGSDHIDTATAMNNHAFLLVKLMKETDTPEAFAVYDRAETYYRHTLRIREQVYGRNSTKVSIILTNLAAVLKLKKQDQQAKDLLDEALAIARTIHRENHPYIAHALNDLGLFYREIGDLDQSYSFLNEALTTYECIYPRDHFNVAVALHNLGDVEIERNNEKKARLLYVRALSICEKVLPANHRAILKIQKKIEALPAA